MKYDESQSKIMHNHVSRATKIDISNLTGHTMKQGILFKCVYLNKLLFNLKLLLEPVNLPTGRSEVTACLNYTSE